MKFGITKLNSGNGITDENCPFKVTLLKDEDDNFEQLTGVFLDIAPAA